MRQGNRLIDLTGQKFGKLKVIGRTKDESFNSGTYWDCQCECGKIKEYRTDVLRKTGIKNCGCGSSSIQIGDQYGKLTIIERVKNQRRSAYWKCKCDCGSNKKVVLSSYSLKNEYNKSCGCLKNPKGEKHPNYTGYKNLTGTVFHRIRQGATKRNINFNISIKQLWDLFEKQKRKCALSGLHLQFGIRSRIKEKREECTASLDRVDNLKGYTIDNVQWVHKEINKMKNTHTQEHFIELCKLVANNFK